MSVFLMNILLLILDISCTIPIFGKIMDSQLSLALLRDTSSQGQYHPRGGCVNAFGVCCVYSTHILYCTLTVSVQSSRD